MNHSVSGDGFRYTVATAVPIAASVVLLLFLTDNFLEITLGAVSLVVCFPIAMMGLYMYLEGKGARLINGVDWSRYTETERSNAASYIGFYLAVGSTVLLASLNILISHMAVGIAVMIVSILIMIVPAIRLLSGYKAGPRRNLSAGWKIAAYVSVLAISLAAVFCLGLGGDSSNTVDVTLGDDSVKVKAPMFDKTFVYSEIEELEYDPDFDKGDRVGGYGTPTISSGKFRNSQFGNYRLASYTQVHPCIWVKYHGSYYAFNQSSADETQTLYEQLRIKTGL